MSFQSSQTHFKGQQGWNDLDPSALDLSGAARRGKTRPRRVFSSHDTSALLASHQASAVNMPPPPPPSSAVSGNKAPPLATPPPIGHGYGMVAPISSSSESCANSQDVESIKSALKELVARPSSLSSGEIDNAIQRIEKALPDLIQEHIVTVHRALNLAPVDKIQARNVLVNHSLQHSNVTSWCVPLRRLIEQQKL